MLVLAGAIFVVSFSKRSINRSSLWLRPAQFAYSRIMNRVGKCEATTVLETCGRSRVSVDMHAFPMWRGPNSLLPARRNGAKTSVVGCGRQALCLPLDCPLHPALTPGYAPAPCEACPPV